MKIRDRQFGHRRDEDKGQAIWTGNLDAAPQEERG
jgi:hypothetical protein